MLAQLSPVALREPQSCRLEMIVNWIELYSSPVRSVPTGMAVPFFGRLRAILGEIKISTVISSG